MKKIIFIVLSFSVFFYSCKNTDNEQKTVDSIAKKVDSKEEPKRIFDVEQPSKVITYTEIIEGLRFSYKNKDTWMIKEVFLIFSDCFSNMLSSELWLLRNEFFARKGYIFKSNDLNEYFLRKRWYNPRYSSISDITLSKDEQQIVDSILVYENKNRELTNEILKNKMKQLLKNVKQKDSFGAVEIDISVALFRRNIGYLIADTSDFKDFEEQMYGIPQSNSLLVLDTIGSQKDILLNGFVKQFDCPDQYCLYQGVLFTCDINFDYVIDSKTIIYNGNLKIERKNNSIICYSEDMPEDYYYGNYYRSSSFVIDSKGKITGTNDNVLQ